jgi:DNA-binding transcriptional ArsR family regulator
MDTFQALADPTRRHIIELLAYQGELSATDISKRFQVSPPAISQHLKILREAKLVDMEKRAQQRIYSVNGHAMLEFEAWVRKMTKHWNERYDTLESVLKFEQKKKRKERD